MDHKNPESTTTASPQALESENERLRARIKALEIELSARSPEKLTSARDSSRLKLPARLSEDTEDKLRDIPGHVREEFDRLARGLSFAVAENLRSTSEIIDSFANDLFERRGERLSEPDAPQAIRSGDRESVDAATDDVLSSIAGGIHKSLEVPRRVVERFLDGYEEERQASSGQRKARTGARSRRSDRIEGKETSARRNIVPDVQP